MDLRELSKLAEQADEGVDVVIYKPNGDPYLASDGTDATMTVVGAESKRYRDAKMTQQRRAIKQASSRGMRGITPEALERNEIELTASAVANWHGWEDDGKPLPCTPENVRTVLAYAHIREQVQVAIQSHGGFFARSSPD